MSSGKVNGLALCHTRLRRGLGSVRRFTGTKERVAVRGFYFDAVDADNRRG